MDFNIPKDARIIIIEGVAGSGKDTLQKQLASKFKGKNVQSYTEEELHFTWRHAKIPNIKEHRIRFMRDFTTYLKQTLATQPDTIFILNRFHISLYMAHISKGVSDELRKTYAAMIKDLQKLPVHIMFLKLTAEQIKNRSQHHERGVDWKRHLKDRLKHEGFSTIVDRYLNEQKVMLEALRKQSISYGIHNLS